MVMRRATSERSSYRIFDACRGVEDFLASAVPTTFSMLVTASEIACRSEPSVSSVRCAVQKAQTSP